VEWVVDKREESEKRGKRRRTPTKLETMVAMCQILSTCLYVCL